MAVTHSREVVIEATPQEILKVMADFESMPEWAPVYRSAEVLETGDDGRPRRAKTTVKSQGVTDEQVVDTPGPMMA